MKMNRSLAAVARRGFTLIELLVVIAIIAILAAMLLPAIGRMKVKAQISQVKQDLNKIVVAATQYETDYSRMPMSQKALDSALKQNPTQDFTFGYDYADSVTVKANDLYATNNCEVMAILMDLEKYPDGQDTFNKGHVKNTKRNKYLDVPMVTDTTLGGVGPAGTFRDVWGNPYIISLDADGDGMTRDAFYTLDAVSQDSGDLKLGLNGLTKKGPGDYRFNGPVMAWSVGPDKKLSKDDKANAGVNKDNVLSWK